MSDTRESLNREGIQSSISQTKEDYKETSAKDVGDSSLMKSLYKAKGSSPLFQPEKESRVRSSPDGGFDETHVRESKRGRQMSESPFYSDVSQSIEVSDVDEMSGKGTQMEIEQSNVSNELGMEVDEQSIEKESGITTVPKHYEKSKEDELVDKDIKSVDLTDDLEEEKSEKKTSETVKVIELKDKMMNIATSLLPDLPDGLESTIGSDGKLVIKSSDGAPLPKISFTEYMATIEGRPNFFTLQVGGNTVSSMFHAIKRKTKSKGRKDSEMPMTRMSVGKTNLVRGHQIPSRGTKKALNEKGTSNDRMDNYSPEYPTWGKKLRERLEAITYANGYYFKQFNQIGQLKAQVEFKGGVPDIEIGIPEKIEITLFRDEKSEGGTTEGLEYVGSYVFDFNEIAKSVSEEGQSPGDLALAIDKYFDDEIKVADAKATEDRSALYIVLEKYKVKGTDEQKFQTPRGFKKT